MPKTLENYQKNVCSGVSLEETPTVAGIQPIPTTGVKIALQIHSGSAHKGNNVLKFCKLQKIFAKLSLFL